MNRRLYGPATALSDEDRRRELGAFFGSLHGTFSHLLWADHMWMSRLDGWPKPTFGIADSSRMVEEWATLAAARSEADARIEAWAIALDAAALDGELRWVSSASGRENSRPRWLVVTHFFNHQTHHRGQAHALLTRLDVQLQATDLPWVVDVDALALT